MTRLQVFLVIPLITLICLSAPVATWSQETEPLDFAKIAAEAEDACLAMNKFNKENEQGLFDFKAITTYGKLADAFLITKRPDKAEKILRLSLDEKDAHRLVATTSVKFGAPIPEIPESLDDAKTQIWKLELFISLAHGSRYDEAHQVLKSFNAKSQNPKVRLRYFKIITKNCLENKNQSQARRFASLMWKQIQLLDEKELQFKLDYSLYLVELALKLKMDDSVKKLLPVVQNQFDAVQSHPDQKIDPESLYRNYRRLGLAFALQGNISAARKYLGMARVEIGNIQDDYFQEAPARAQLHLAFAEAFRLADRKNDSLDHTNQALTWLQKIENDKAQSTAKSIDGGTGFFSAVLGFSQFSDHKEVVIAQAKLGEIDTAIETWNSIPFSIQKIRCQIELAKIFHEKGQAEKVKNCADRCLEMIDSKAELAEEVLCFAAAAVIFHQSKQMELRDQLINKLKKKVTASKNEAAKQSLANELISLGMHTDAYHVIQSIVLEKDRALPLASLSKALSKRL